MSTSTSTDYDTFYIRRVLHFSVSEKGILRFVQTWGTAPTTQCPCKFLLPIYMFDHSIWFVQRNFNLSVATYWLPWLTIRPLRTCHKFKGKEHKLSDIMKCVDNGVSQVGSNIFHTLTRTWKGKWTLTNGSDKHKFHHINSVNFRWW